MQVTALHIPPRVSCPRFVVKVANGGAGYHAMCMDRQDWDDRYRTEELIWRAEPNRFLVEEVAGLPPGRALDLACGEGRNALWLAERGWSVTGVDFSGVALAKARRWAAERHLQLDLVEADLLEWEAPALPFDLVVVLYLHLPAQHRRRVLRRAVRGLAPGGRIVVVGHDSTNISNGFGGPQDPAVLFSPADIVADLEGLQPERAERVRRPVTDDNGHHEAIDALVTAVRAAVGLSSPSVAANPP